MIGLPYVCAAEAMPRQVSMRAAHPELAHRLIRLAGVRQMVARAAIGLGRELQTMLMGEAAVPPGVVVDDQLGDGPPQVPEETLGDLGLPTTRPVRTGRKGVMP